MEHRDGYEFSFCLVPEEGGNYDVKADVLHNGEKVGGLEGCCKLMERKRGFHGRCQERSMELSRAGATFCDFCGNFRDVKFADNGGLFLCFELVYLNEEHKGKDVGIHFLHAVLSWLMSRKPWAIAVVELSATEEAENLEEQQKGLRKVGTQFCRLGFKQRLYAGKQLYLLPDDLSLKTKEDTVVPAFFWHPDADGYTDQDEGLRQSFASDRAPTPATIRRAIASGASIDRSQILHESAQYGRAATVKMLLQTFGAQVNAQDSTGLTPLHLATGGAGGFDLQLATVQLLLHHGADKELQDKSGRTAADIALDNVTDQMDRKRVFREQGRVDLRILELVTDGLIDKSMSPRMFYLLLVVASVADDTIFHGCRVWGQPPTSHDDLMWVTWLDTYKHPQEIQKPREYAVGFAAVVKAVFRLLDQGRLPTVATVGQGLDASALYYLATGGTVQHVLAALLADAYEQITFGIGDEVTFLEAHGGEEWEDLPEMPRFDTNFSLISHRMGLAFSADPTQ